IRSGSPRPGGVQAGHSGSTGLRRGCCDRKWAESALAANHSSNGEAAMKDVSAYLKHIRESIAKIEKYTKGGRKTFLEDTMIQDSVIRNLEIIGEAAGNLPANLRKAYPKVPWRSMTGMRNVLIH